MSPEQIAAIIGLVLSLAFDLVPGIKEWWESLSDERKRAAWLIGCVAIPGVLWGFACVGGLDPFGFEWGCDTSGFVDMLYLAFAAYGLYQGSHSVVKLVRSAKK
jgi:hypothetical protein